jgi:hypothetical protein
MGRSRRSGQSSINERLSKMGYSNDTGIRLLVLVGYPLLLLLTAVI